MNWGEGNVKVWLNGRIAESDPIETDKLNFDINLIYVGVGVGVEFV